MDIRKLQRAIVDGLEDVKAQHIAVFNTEHLSSMFERVIIASGTSNRQTKALAASVRNSVKERGMQVMSTEGEDNGEWIIVDCGAAVAHIMQPAVREYYHLEEIWGGKAVRMKVGELNTKLVKASEPEPAARKSARPAAKSAAPAKPGLSRKAAQTEADKKSANRSAAFKRVAAKAPAKRPQRESSAPATQTVVVKSPSKTGVKTAKAPAKKAAARKTPARKAPARSTRG
jgi:ribosome-associated protein